MDLFVLLTFASFFVVLAVASTWRRGMLRSTVRRPRLFRDLVLGTAAVLVPIDLYVALYEATGITLGAGRGALDAIAGVLLLLNVAACCGVAALQHRLRTGAPQVEAVADRDLELRMGVLGWVGPLVAFVVLGGITTLDPAGDGPQLGAVGPVWAFYSVLICLISAYALLRGRAREASGPREG